MEKEKRALSWREFVESGFDGREYQFPDFEGTFAATIACKRWNKSKNLLVYLDLDDGRKIITATWNKDNFFGLADMPAGTRVSVRFKTAVSTGKTYLNYAEQESSEIGMNDEITAKDCKPISHDDAIEDKVIVIRGNVLRPEFRHDRER